LSTGRQAAVLDLIDALGWRAEGAVFEPDLPDRSVLERFHDPVYLDALERTATTNLADPEDRRDFNLGTMECPIFPGLWDRARATIGGSMLAARLALEGYVAFHPGGGTHHGRPDRASGFCYLNDPVFAIQTLLDGGAPRVIYVDFDAHHGDGVQDLLAADERVTFVSVHEEGRWPGSGRLDDRLDGRACNIMVPRGLNDSEFDCLVERIVLPAIDRLQPEGLVMTLGADALKGDPLSGMMLSNDALWRAAEACIAGVEHAVILGGGGYNPWTTARLWAGLWGRLRRETLPHVLPDEARAVLERLECDLIDAEDREAEWTATLCDSPNPGPVRPIIRDIVRQLTI
jgi:acetoin utilization protein AcuC